MSSRDDEMPGDATSPGSQNTLRSNDVVIRDLLLRNAENFPDDRFVLFEDGTEWSWRDACAAACGAANILKQAGLRQGDRVAVMLPNGKDYLRAWWGTVMLGAVVVPVNLAFRGAMLGHLLKLAQPRALICGEDFLERFEPLEDLLSGLLRIAPAALSGKDQTVPELERPIHYWDIHALMLTSGTTGPSKLSATTYRHTYTGGAFYLPGYGCGKDDMFLADLPLFHLGAMYHVVGSFTSRSQIALRTRPDLANYWRIVRETGVTAGLLLSTMVPYLLAQPERDSDRDHNLKLMLAAPLPRDITAFQSRFGIERVQTALGSTEMPGPIIGDPRDPLVYSYCGRARSGFRIRLVDENDEEVPAGESGELVVRPDDPWTFSAGYIGDDAATARAWRNGWFHSGDKLKRDENGRFFFVDKVGDSVRRRGENISTAEVEAELAEHPDVLEVACVAFREPGWVDDELKAWIVSASGAAMDFEKLLKFAVEKLPHFMVPRYFEPIAELPKTASTRVQKFALRSKGNSEQTWDREAHGFIMTRSGLQRLRSALA